MPIIPKTDSKESTDETPTMPKTPTAPPKTIEKIITSRDLDRPEVVELIREKAKQHLEKHGQLMLDYDNVDEKIKTAIAPMIEQKIKFNIDIPDIIVIQTNAQIKVYNDFELYTGWGLDFDAPADEIIIESLKTNEVSTLKDDMPVVLPDTPSNMIISEMLNIEIEIDFGLYEGLLYKLAGQALSYIGKNKTEQELEKTIFQYKKDIAKRIIEQLDRKSELSPPEYEIKLLRAVTPILQQDYTKFKEDDIVKYTANIPAYEIKKKVVGHFTKACHTAYKFDSVPEHIFSIVLERSDSVLKWLRPAMEQFKIVYGTRQYQPDFVVETISDIYIVEIKANNRTDDTEVKLKAKAARAYCENVNTIFVGTGAKTWKYMLLLDSEPNRSVDFAYLEGQIEWWSMA